MATFDPFPYQADDLAKARKHNYRALLNMGTGSGKTAETLFAIRDSGADVSLVIAPEQTHANAWLPTVPKILGIEGRVIGNKNKATKQAMTDFLFGYPGLYLVTPELFTRADVSEWRGDFLAVDEAHKLANPRTRGQRKLGGGNVADDEPLAARFDGRFLLSGTILRNKFELAWSHSQVLWPELSKRGEIAHNSLIVWQNDRMDYTTVYTNQRDRNGNVKTVKQYYGEKEPGRWMSEAPCVITHWKRENCCEHHPNGYLPLNEPTEKRETITLAPAQKKAIREMESVMMTYLDENPLVAEIPLTSAARIRQLTLGVPTVTYDEDEKAEVSFDEDCVSPFYNRLEEFLTEEAADENVVVYVDSQKFAEVVTARLNRAGVPAFEFSGKTRNTRQADLEQFGTKYRVVVGVIAAISEGVDSLQHVSKTEVWLSRSTDETLNEQAMGRLDRIGQRGQVFRLMLEDDLGLAQGRYSEALEKRLMLNRSLKSAQAL